MPFWGTDSTYVESLSSFSYHQIRKCQKKKEYLVLNTSNSYRSWEAKFKKIEYLVEMTMCVVYFCFIIRWMTDFQVPLSFEVTVDSIKTFMFSFWQTVLFTGLSDVDFPHMANCIKWNAWYFFKYNFWGPWSCWTELSTVVFRQACSPLGCSWPLLHLWHK